MSDEIEIETATPVFRIYREAYQYNNDFEVKYMKDDGSHTFTIRCFKDETFPLGVGYIPKLIKLLQKAYDDSGFEDEDNA